MAAARADAGAAAAAAGEADEIARAARQRADETRDEAERTRHDLDGVDDRLRTARAATPAPPPAGAAVPAPAEARADEVPDVEPVAAEGLSDDARERLVRYLNDVLAVEREQAGLLGQLADAAAETDFRAEIEEHRAVSHRQHHAIGERLRALGVEPDGGRGLFGQVVTRVWDALHQPRDDADEAVGAVLKALGAAEFEAGLYLTVHALARTVGDDETAELAAAHLRQERALADRIRARVTPAAVRAARRPAEPAEA